PPSSRQLLPAGATLAGWDYLPLRDRAFTRRTQLFGLKQTCPTMCAAGASDPKPASGLCPRRRSSQARNDADRYVLFVEQNSQRISASRRVAALAFAAATSATSVLVIGRNPSFLLSTRCSGRIATSGRMLTPMPTDTAAWILERLGLV